MFVTILIRALREPEQLCPDVRAQRIRRTSRFMASNTCAENVALTLCSQGSQRLDGGQEGKVRVFYRGLL